MYKKLAQFIPEPLRPAVRRITAPLWRRQIAMSYYGEKIALARKWAWKDTETSNHYYELTPLNREYLAHTVSMVTGVAFDQVVSYFEELEGDRALKSHIEGGLITANYGRDIIVNYGRRLGWYAFVRATKPAVVVETGVDHGVGSCVLASAILRNRNEGYPGQYFGTELRPDAGKLFCGAYAEAGEILYGDSIATLKAFNRQIDLFINDSDHSADYEFSEYETVIRVLSERALVLGDNSHSTDRLAQFSRKHGRNFLFFAESPKNHWYPGAGIGISFQKTT